MPVFDRALECEMKQPDTASHLNQLWVEFPNLETWSLPSGPPSQL